MEKKQFSFEAKALDTPGMFEGHGSVFNVEDQGKDIVKPGAFKRSLSKQKAEGRMPSMLWAHDTHLPPIGVWKEMSEDSHGLFVRGQLFLDDNEISRQVHAAVKANALTGLSIGYQTVDSDINESNVREIAEIKLFEVSIVNFPMNESARIESVKAQIIAGEPPSKIDMERMFREQLGFSQNQAKAYVFGGHSAFVERCAPGAADTDAIEAMRRAMATLRA